MGVDINVNGYKKEPGCIVGQISFLGCYEVKIDAISKFKIRNDEISHRGSLHMMSVAKEHLQELDLSMRDFFFYDFASCYWDGQSIGKYEGETTHIMFEPSKLLYPVSQLLDKRDTILDFVKDTFFAKEMVDYEEVEFLTELKKLIEEAIEQDALIGIWIS